MKEFKKGILIGLGIIVIVLPTIGIVNAINTPTLAETQQQSFAPITSRFYQFEPKELEPGIISAALNKNASSVLNTYRNYWTGSRLVDIIEFDSGLSVQQQTTLQSIYPHKVVNGLDKLPTPQINKQ